MNYIRNLSRRQWVTLGALSGFSLFYKKKAAFEIVYKETEANKKILEFCKSLAIFKPTVYLLGGPLQAYFGANDTFFDQNVQYKNEYVKIDGKGNFLIEWAYLREEKVQNENNNKLIVIIPGITASSNEPYIINMISECLKKGFNVVMYNDRLYSENSPSFHLNDENYYCYLDDLSNVFKHIFEQTNFDEYYAIGHSLGANTLVRYLGSEQQNKLKAVVSVANPWDLNVVQQKLSGAYDKYILESRQYFLKKKQFDIESHLQLREKTDIDLQTCMNVQTSVEFDDCFTRKIHGNYNSIKEYFNKMASAAYIHNIKIPLLCLQSMDDPICHHESIPVQKCKENENILLWMSQTGGHVGWYQGFFQPKRWYMQPALEFIEYHSQQYKSQQDQIQIQ